MRAHLQIKVGTYTGDGNDNRAITGIGFRPDFVLIKGGTTSACWRTRQMRLDSSCVIAANTANAADQIQAFLADGFQVGTTTVNTNAVAYYYIAIRGVSAQSYFRTGNYRGDGNDNRDFAAGGLNFTPDLVMIKSDTTEAGTWKSSAVPGDLSELFSGVAGQPNYIQALASNGFQLGTNAIVNSSGIEYFFAAMKALKGVMAVGTYTGNGVDNRNIDGLGFQPDCVWVKNSTGTNQGVFRTSAHVGDVSEFFGTAASAANGIQGFRADGFQIGNSSAVNANGSAYYWVAFKAGSFLTPVTRLAA